MGLAYYKEKVLYEGYFIQGSFEGKGIIKINNGAVYIGDVRHGIRHGIGAFTTYAYIYIYIYICTYIPSLID